MAGAHRTNHDSIGVSWVSTVSTVTTRTVSCMLRPGTACCPSPTGPLRSRPWPNGCCGIRPPAPGHHGHHPHHHQAGSRAARAVSLASSSGRAPTTRLQGTARRPRSRSVTSAPRLPDECGQRWRPGRTHLPRARPPGRVPVGWRTVVLGNSHPTCGAGTPVVGPGRGARRRALPRAGATSPQYVRAPLLRPWGVIHRTCVP